MGNCASSQLTKKGGSPVNWQSTAKIIHPDGRLQEFKQPIRASHVLTQNPDHFLCSSEAMYINSHVPHVPEEEELHLGQLYFLVPLSLSHSPLSLQQLCSLAIKASKALSTNAGAGKLYKVPAGFGGAGLSSHLGGATKELST